MPLENTTDRAGRHRRTGSAQSAVTNLGAIADDQMGAQTLPRGLIFVDQLSGGHPALIWLQTPYPQMSNPVRSGPQFAE